MQHTIHISLEISEDMLINEVLSDLADNREIDEILLTNDVASADRADEKKLSTIAKSLHKRLFMDVYPCPYVNYDFKYIKKPSQAVKSTKKRDQRSNKALLVVSVDFDGCADTPRGKAGIVEDIHDYVAQHSSIKGIVVMIGSLRQSLELDYYNAINNKESHHGELKSCFKLGNDFIEQLSQYITLPIEFNPLMMSDVLNHLEIGTTYEAMGEFHEELKKGNVLLTKIVPSVIPNMYINLLGKSQYSNVMPASQWVDISKISLMILQMHYAASNYLDTQDVESIHFRFYDDREDILSPLYCNLNDHDLVPEHVSFSCIKNTSETAAMPLFVEPLGGTGRAVTDYRGLINHFAENTSKLPSSFSMTEVVVVLYQSFCQDIAVAQLSQPIHTRFVSKTIEDDRVYAEKSSSLESIVMEERLLTAKEFESAHDVQEKQYDHLAGKVMNQDDEDMLALTSYASQTLFKPVAVRGKACYDKEKGFSMEHQRLPPAKMP